ncbi:MAG TPA: type I-B CRISPR-associated protein Cas5 [Candidatus Marinimicrobia bacterium]|nr:type I-B CRISPR-associated protein Cas5 [Candidatus Neomarinimicrobiota bacterium]
MKKLISIDLKTDLGFLKKPDINEGIFLTYNMLHKPVLLGILGAIVGLEGYREKSKLPEYYIQLKNIQIGIQPLRTTNGNFLKSVVEYNNGVGYASQEAGGNLIVREQMLIRPAFCCFVELDTGDPVQLRLLESLQHGEADYLPYFGKNEFSLWWDEFREYNYQPFDFSENYEVATIFMKSKEVIKEMVQKKIMAPFAMNGGEPKFMIFEELPVGFDEQLLQYEKQPFVYTNFTLSKELQLEGLFRVQDHHGLVQLF